MRSPIAIAVLLLSVSPIFPAEPGAKSLLRDAAARYRNSKQYRIEFETTITHSSAYSSGWSRQIYVVAAADNKYHFEVDGSSRHSIRINDGRSDWFYRPSAREYSVQSAVRSGDADSTRPPMGARGAAAGTTEGWIKSAIQSLLRLDDDADDAEIQGEGVVTISGGQLPCYVVHAAESMSFQVGANSTRDNTYWIEKATGLVRKAVTSTHGPQSREDDSHDQSQTIETVYTRMDLDTPSDPVLFEFKPPADAYLIDDARQPASPPVTVGSPAPVLKLKERNGAVFDLDQFKGKVVLVDFWASWCGACTEEFKALSQLRGYEDKRLVIVCVDEDEVPDQGDHYFSSQKYSWKNLHDVGEIDRRTWGVSGFPFVVLVDRDGKVAWTSTGMATGFLETLRSHLDTPELRLKP